MRNLKVGTRLSIGFGILMLLTAAIVVDAIISMQSIKFDLDKIVGQNIYKMTLVQDMSESVHIVSRVTRTMILLQDDAAISREEEKIKAARAKYDVSVELLQHLEPRKKLPWLSV